MLSELSGTDSAAVSVFLLIIWLQYVGFALYLAGIRLSSLSKYGLLLDRIGPGILLVVAAYLTYALFSRLILLEMLYVVEVVLLLGFLAGIVQGFLERTKDHEG